MTEKRFTHKKWYDERQLFDGEEPFAIVDVYNQADTICDKLNELAEENKQLQLKLEQYERIMSDFDVSSFGELRTIMKQGCGV